MRRFVLLSAVLAIALPATAGPISFSENWDSYPSQASYLLPVDDATWPQLGTSTYVVTNARSQSTSNSLLVDNGSSYASDKGISHDFGGVYKATDANPIVVDFYLWVDSAANRANIDVFVELALDDQAPSSSGVLYNVVAFALPNSVRGTLNKQAYLYDGTNWSAGSVAPTAGGWDHMTMTIKSNTIDVAAGGASNGGFPRTYMGNFDQINIRHPVLTSAGAAWLDNLSVTGGELIPEPATLALLALGGLFLRRRR
ncbi:MAG: PEP-CTERM sorting domain-containing protein [Phycisphaerae bacterium]|nr:PEP-CTERM sorting domain-containing protein [Phycisphaerae bacterium]